MLYINEDFNEDIMEIRNELLKQAKIIMSHSLIFIIAITSPNFTLCITFTLSFLKP